MLLPGLSALLTLGAAVLIVATAGLTLQAAAMVVLRDRKLSASMARPSIAVLIPAHNEEENITATLAHIEPQLLPGDQFLVVADNCTDRTESLAAQAGADVLVRSDAVQTGKGFALAAGLRHLARAPPAVVIFVDADCRISCDGLDRLARACAATHDPIQCLNLMVAEPDSAAPLRLAEFAWRVKNDFRPSGYARLGLPCQLLGTGMAVPWTLIDPDVFATGHLAEDVLFGLELAMAGHPARFCRDARVTSCFPDTQGGQLQQKQRWIHGHLGLVMTHLPRLVHLALRRRDIRLLALALDLAVPPLGVLAAAGLCLLGLDLLYLAVTGVSTPLVVTTLAVAMLAFSVLSAWFACGRDLIGAREIARAPRHLAMVVRAALAWAQRRPTQWIRADRRRSSH